MPCDGERSENHVEQFVVVFVRPVGDGSANRRARRFGRGRDLQLLRRGELPIDREGARELRDDWTARLKVQIRHTAVRSFTDLTTPYIHAAEKPDLTVDDQKLAVVAQVDRQSWKGQQSRSEEARRAHAGTAQQRDRMRPAVPFTHTVNQRTHLDATSRRARKRGDESPTHRISLEDVSREPYRLPRSGDGFEHRGEGVFPILEWLDGIPRDTGPLG